MTDQDAAEVILRKPLINCHECSGKGFAPYFGKSAKWSLCLRCGGSGKKPTKEYKQACKQLGLGVLYDRARSRRAGPQGQGL